MLEAEVVSVRVRVRALAMAVVLGADLEEVKAAVEALAGGSDMAAALVVASVAGKVAG